MCARDEAWLTRRREGEKAARSLRLLTGAHPSAEAPWRRVQIDSTPCDIRLVREGDRTRDLLPLWNRGNGQRVERVVAYDPRSLAQVWVADEVTGEYIAPPYRVPHPDMALAESEEARRPFDNLAEIRAITAQARSSTARQKAERSRQARQGARLGRTLPSERRMQPENRLIVGASNNGEVGLEPLSLLRRPTLWPQRPRLLPGELFSSRLWRTAVAAGVEPRRFALHVLGARCADVDRGVPDAVLHRLAPATGQRVETLASSTRREDWIRTWTGRADGWASLMGAPAASPVMLAEHVALREPRLLLARAGPKRNGRARPALQ